MTLIDYIEDTGNTTWTNSSNYSPNSIEFANDDNANATLAVGDYTFTIKPGEYFDVRLPIEFDEIVITSAGSFRLKVGA